MKNKRFAYFLANFKAKIAEQTNQVAAMSQCVVVSVYTDLADVMRRAFKMGKSVHIDGGLQFVRKV